ncbi:MAG: hypothetical protein Ct9H300mP9_7700 [Candidatus Neomarinimicrobiota bacterium]|nr:MAG: hypothetical protein Ct9H300mP9_7700 [Candidatus Neomarinimicrobiota bacterium]
MIYGIFDYLDHVDIYEMVKWVDEYYSHGEYANRPSMKLLSLHSDFSKQQGVLY